MTVNTKEFHVHLFRADEGFDLHYVLCPLALEGKYQSIAHHVDVLNGRVVRIAPGIGNFPENGVTLCVEVYFPSNQL